MSLAHYMSPLTYLDHIKSNQNHTIHTVDACRRHQRSNKLETLAFPTPIMADAAMPLTHSHSCHSFIHSCHSLKHSCHSLIHSPQQTKLLFGRPNLPRNSKQKLLDHTCHILRERKYLKIFSNSTRTVSNSNVPSSYRSKHVRTLHPYAKQVFSETSSHMGLACIGHWLLGLSAPFLGTSVPKYVSA